MCGYVCPRCGEVAYIFGKGGGERAAGELNVPFLGRLPIDARSGRSPMGNSIRNDPLRLGVG
ncbi:TPA: hypothetical protein EYP44_02815 [Candidatus Bathyarchaeota archaeon]|nr:hypothetical protein [Candidatus Bathyarchaeota archaeon]